MKTTTRRDFLKQTGIITAGISAAALAVPKVHAAEDNTIKVALVGCGGRGGGAVMQALSTAGPKKLVAVADVFDYKVNGLYKGVAEQFPKDVDVPAERRFTGFDAYKHAVDAAGPGGVVLFATAPAFRPLHVEYAVEKGVNVFMEKSFGTDPAGVRRLMKAGELAKAKNLKIVGGLMSRHKTSLEAAVEQLHSGIIGERITCWAYREHGPVGLGKRQEGEKEVAYQIRNYSNFTWLNGSFLLDWLIHNLDVCCWAKGAYPVSAQGMGGRQQRKEKDQLFDHYAVEYTFADGTRLFAQGRHQNNTWGCFQSTIHGEKGVAIIGEGVANPKIYKGWNPKPENVIWEYKEKEKDQYQIEHDVLFDCIRNDKPVNETERCCFTALTGIMGRVATETGRTITWDEVLKSEESLAPNIDTLSFDGPAPVMPNENGDYPVAVPGT
ncbi:MAG: twin-arginine translocation signal domain-containing protein [Planctomycetaceae bacterium]|jgi:predicted dehydrogenase|nr:twin-arginine translocation signal domain-containing protein [Planctomycetaceae bacterium]